ncbi:GNAT family protein [Actinomyces viscosus]|uniref:Ribosomal-protein-alanine acetyltransferase n=1 Tax=Actinomyces viscosus TaxID=1656 RepID=A0A448PGQ4_ACTVI|nr:hypothetical protein [Actinomyces viscosus]VEI14149.1 ribosomal-protein-alanine acetyltransferase [Actinomyces viscosus]
MLAELVDTARKAGCPDVLLEVRQSNQTAPGDLRQARVRPIGRRRRYYQAPPEDAVVMRLTLRSAWTLSERPRSVSRVRAEPS